MATQLQDHINQIQIVDTHEHQRKQDWWEEDKPDIINEVFENYVGADFGTAGVAEEAMKTFRDSSNGDIEARFAGVADAWDAIQFTGYAEACRILARHFYGIDEITGKSLAAAQAKLPAKWEPAERLRILKEEGGLDHIQTDDFCWPCVPDRGDVDFFTYDLSWAGFCGGNVDPKAIHEEVGVEVKDLESLREAMTALFDKYGKMAIAVKAQHAYNRTLKWQARSEAEAARSLELALAKPEDRSAEEKNCIGDWCWARGVELAIEHDLPFKLHTGYYAGNHRMPVDFIKAGNLCELLKTYRECRFVLMHISYPYENEIVALAKHYTNVWVDLCWAWSIDPHSSGLFVRRFLHAAPINKLFAFGGDTGRPSSGAAYAMQARKWLGKALQAEVTEGELTEAQACAVADRVLHDNQYACFDIEGTRGALREYQSANA